MEHQHVSLNDAWYINQCQQTNAQSRKMTMTGWQNYWGSPTELPPVAAYEKIPLHVNYKFLHYKEPLSLFSWVPVCVYLYFQLISHSKRGTWEAEEAGLVQPGEEKTLGDLMAALQYLQGGYWEDAAKLLTRMHSRRTRNHVHNLKQEGSELI